MPFNETEQVTETEVNNLLPEDNADYEVDESVLIYIKEVGKIPTLIETEEQKLAEEMASGSEEAKTRVIEANLQLAVSIAKQFAGKGMSFLDLIQEANLGLTRAAEEYDPKRGCRFSDYAAERIKQAVSSALAEFSRPLNGGLPIHISESIETMIAVSERLETELGRKPSDEEIAKAAKLPLKLVSIFRQTKEGTTSFDT